MFVAPHERRNTIDCEREGVIRDSTKKAGMETMPARIIETSAGFRNPKP